MSNKNDMIYELQMQIMIHHDKAYLKELHIL